MSEGMFSLLLDARWTKKKGQPAIAQNQRARFIEMIQFARSNSAYHRQLSRDLPERLDEITLLTARSMRPTVSCN